MLIIILLIIFIEITALAAVILIFGSFILSNFYGAPYVPIRKSLIRDFLEFADLKKNDVFCDLGSGDARVLISAVRNFGLKKALGYEITPWPYLKSRFLIRYLGFENIIKIYRRNFSKADLSEATFIYMYLFPKIVDRLAEKIAQEAGGGVKILSLSFSIDTARYPQFKLLKSEKIANITGYLYQLN